jgi:hypothetical protein
MRKPTLPAKPEPEPEKFERWTAQRKAAIILEVLKGQISVPEACRKHGITQGEFRDWADESQLSITGNAIANLDIANLNPAIASRFGFSVSQINSITIALQAFLP